MNRRNFIHTLPILLMSALVWGAHASDPGRAASHAAAGVYAVNFQVAVPSTVPDGSTVSCKARITPGASFLDGLMHKSTAIESALASARVVGSAAQCAVQVPFTYAAGEAGNVAQLSYRIDAENGDRPLFVRIQERIAVPHPQAGAEAAMRLKVNF